jgi:hypothetical protein
VRDRAASDHEAMQSMFKNELHNHLSGHTNKHEEKKYATKKNNQLVIEEE